MERGTGKGEEDWRGELGRVRRIGRDKSIGVLIHICMGTTQRIFLCNYLHLKLAKTACFSNYVLCLLFYTVGEQEGKQVLPRRWGNLAPVGGERWQGKG
jgi:hypothetical protein